MVVLLAIFAVLLGPVSEELVFRGFLQPCYQNVRYGCRCIADRPDVWVPAWARILLGLAVRVCCFPGRSGLRRPARKNQFDHPVDDYARRLQCRFRDRDDCSEIRKIEMTTSFSIEKNVAVENGVIETIEWTPEGVVMLDQTRLPRETVFVTCRDYGQVADAIRNMVIRGAPAIGVAAAMGVALGALHSNDLEADMPIICDTLARTRPTAVNLFWGIDRMRNLYDSLRHRPVDEIRERLVAEAALVRSEDIAINRAIGQHGAPLVPDRKTVLTHCNAGALATAGFGTALGVIRAAVLAGKKIDVFADEKRPFLQGARLTAWELQRDGIETTLITDNMAGHFLHSGRIGCVVVGADRIAANGDVANKIGTYGVAVLGAGERSTFLCCGADLDTGFDTEKWDRDPD